LGPCAFLHDEQMARPPLLGRIKCCAGLVNEGLLTVKFRILFDGLQGCIVSRWHRCPARSSKAESGYELQPKLHCQFKVLRRLAGTQISQLSISCLELHEPGLQVAQISVYSLVVFNRFTPQIRTGLFDHMNGDANDSTAACSVRAINRPIVIVTKWRANPSTSDRFMGWMNGPMRASCLNRRCWRPPQELPCRQCRCSTRLVAGRRIHTQRTGQSR